MGVFNLGARLATDLFKLRVSETDLDVFGHVNNAHYLRFFEMARWSFLNKKGLSLSELLRTKIGPVILEVELKFLRELKQGEEVRIESHYEPFQGKICRIVQKILKEDGALSANAQFKAAIFDLSQRKIIEPTGVWAKLSDSL